VSPIIIACSLLFSLASVADCQPQETAEQFVERVEKAIRNDEWGRAASGIRHALALKPASPAVLLLAAQVYFHEGARSMAIESLERAIKNQPAYPEAHVLLARCLIEAGRYERAREEVSVAINQGTPLYPAYRLLGVIDSAEGKFESAATSFETALVYLQVGDENEAAKLQSEIEDLHRLIVNLKRVQLLVARQSAPDIVGPFLLNNPQPRYTDEARRAKVQGTVSIILLVNENGDVDSVLVLRGLGLGLDEQATEVARNMKFSPATKGGQPIPYWKKVSVEFNLK
jgi:TonB family protein